MYKRQGSVALSGPRRSGVGEYDAVGNWSWEYYPPPYDFLAPANAAPQSAPILFPQGMSGCGGGCGCGGKCGHAGVGGFLDAFDFSQWEWTDWLMAIGGLYFISSLWGDTKRAKTRVSKYSRARAAKARRRKELASI